MDRFNTTRTEDHSILILVVLISLVLIFLAGLAWMFARLYAAYSYRKRKEQERTSSAEPGNQGEDLPPTYEEAVKMQTFNFIV